MLHELKDMLCDELAKYAEKGELTAGSLDVIDKLAHAAKNVAKLIDEDGYSNRYSYKRDRMGRYTRDGFAEKLRDMSHDAPDEKTRAEMRRLADRM